MYMYMSIDRAIFISYLLWFLLENSDKYSKILACTHFTWELLGLLNLPEVERRRVTAKSFTCSKSVGRYPYTSSSTQMLINFHLTDDQMLVQKERLYAIKSTSWPDIGIVLKLEPI